MTDITFQSVSSSDIDSRNSIRSYNGKTSLLKNHFQKLKYIIKNVLNIFGSILIISYLLSVPHCMLREDVGRSHLTSALFAGAGISYIFLEIVSNKLIISGGSRLGYILSILVYLDQRKCPGAGDIFAMGTNRRSQEWQLRLQVVQGAVIITCIVQILLAILGVDRLARCIRPVTIAPTMLLISISVIKTTAVRMADTCWTLFFATTCLMFLSYTTYYYFCIKNEGNCDKLLNIRHNLHIGVICGLTVWTLCVLLSSMEYIESGSPARTDVFIGPLNYASPLRLSYLFQWGKPKLEVDAIFLILPACFFSISEILASYYDNCRSQHKWSGAKKEKQNKTTWSSIVRWEAAFCLLNVTMGTALGIKIGFKKRNQEYVGFLVGIILVLIALSGKLCSLFVIVPEPIVSALIFLAFMSIFFEGLNVMKCINFRSKKNFYIIGSSLFLGCVIPALVKGKFICITGRPMFDHVLVCLLSIEFLVAGSVALILDNLIPVFTPKQVVLPINEKLQPVDQKVEPRESIHFCDCFVPFFV